MAQAIQGFEKEMIARAQEGVSLSRRAGFEVHDLDAITESSALFQYPQIARMEAALCQDIFCSILAKEQMTLLLLEYLHLE